MPSFTTILPAGLVITTIILIGVLFSREQLSIGKRHWLMLTLIVSLLTLATYMLPEDAETRWESAFIGGLTLPSLGVILTNLMIILFGAQTLHYLQFNRRETLWIVLCLVWWIAQAGTTIASTDLVVGKEGWYGTIYDPVVIPGVLALAGWMVIGGVLMVVSFYAFYKARLPEIANRALFWAMIVPMVLVGAVLSTSGSDWLAVVGLLVQFIGLVGAIYSVIAYRVFDLRRATRRFTVTATLTTITALVFYAMLLVTHSVDGDKTTVYAILAGVAFGGAILFIPLRTVAQGFVNRAFGAPGEALALLLRKFSEEITGVVELDALVDVTMNTLSQVLKVRRGGLLLIVKEDDEALYIEPVLHGLGEIPDIQGQISCNGPISDRLLKSRAPLLQYDLDYGRIYSDVSTEEKRFFQQLRMVAYAPVVVQGHLIGVLCCGAKSSDDPFTNRDLEFMMTVANQAGVALRNARLVADLRRRENEQADLNKALSTTKEELLRLDSVKTDFITIASHELRTPLAQIRGYTDIMEAMNEQNMLDQDQITGMTANLRKAADRLENLIGAMLDVSQLDVNAMDLRFAQTGIENVVRMAIEPLTESIKSRKLMVSARGLRGLPPLQADMQRLVQAFRNIVLNAIKYTPDGGRIDISGKMQGDELIISIQDSGVGIDPANHKLIFEKFYRAHDPSLHSTGATKFMGAGPGLGLTIARGVVEGHGGRIWVDSEKYDPDNCPGSTFYIALPLNPPAEAKRVMPFEIGKGAANVFVGGLESLFAPQPDDIGDSSPTILKKPG